MVQRRSVLCLYAWTLIMAGDAVALRFIPYSERGGELVPGWAAFMGGLLLLGVAASLYLVWVLEILKFRRVRAWQLRRADPETAEHEIDEQVERELETGEFGLARTGIERAKCAANRTCGVPQPLVPSSRPNRPRRNAAGR